MPRAGYAQPGLLHRLVLAMALLDATGVSALPAIQQQQQQLLNDQKILQPVDSEQPQPQAHRKLQGRFLHISDFHPDEFYKVHSSTEEDDACHRGKGLAGTYGAEKTDCDSPLSLVNDTFKWIQDNIRDSVDFVVWTGDSARHDNDEKHPRHEPEILRTNRLIADKFAETFSSSSKNNKLDIPVVPTFGNNDFLPHNIMPPGPNKWLAYYSDIWKRFIPEEQRHSFGFGGWFYVEVIPNRLAVFSLNTMYFFDRNAGVDGCAHPSEPGYKHLEWLRVQLQTMRNRGMKAILMGHVPPARTESKQLWDETCWQKYTLWLKQYRDVVTASLYGHMNIDHFLLQDTKDLTQDLGAEHVSTRDFLEDEVSVSSKEDYLQELRDKWSDLPKSIARALTEPHDEIEDVLGKKKKKKKGNKNKKNKGKYGKIGGKHAERYQLSLIGPSVVPNYFPTLRIIEYNITGAESSTLWQDSYDPANPPAPLTWPSGDDNMDYENLGHALEDVNEKTKGKDRNGRKPPNGHNLVIPDDPPKKSLPGPAYAPQPFSLTGYTQYYANLTHINDDIPDEGIDDRKWRKGEHDAKKPKHRKPNPRAFQFEVEYSTFDDKFYKLSDLTVKSYLKLAYRIGQKVKGEDKGESLNVWEEEEEDLDQDDSQTDDASTTKKKTKKHKKKKNKTWLRFLSRAFVSTVPEEELEDM